MHDYLTENNELHIVPNPYSIKQLDVFLVDQHYHNNYQSPNRKKQLIDKDQILSFINDA